MVQRTTKRQRERSREVTPCELPDWVVVAYPQRVRILQQTVEETLVFLVPQTQEQTVEVTSDFPQELMQQRTMEQIDDV